MTEMNTVTLRDIASWAEKQGYCIDVIGDETAYINGFSSLKNYKEGTITWIKKLAPEIILPERITCAVVQEGIDVNIQNKLVTNNSKDLFFAILRHFFEKKEDKPAVGSGTFIGDSVTLGKNVHIGCNCTLDGEIHIGDNTIIEHSVAIMNNVEIGEDCIIHSCVVIGKDGFGFSFDKDNIPRKVPHFGGVKIGNRVEIGSFTVVDRGTIDDTVVGNDVKIDSHSTIAHNAEVGNASMIVAAGMAGSSKIGEKSYLGPKSSIKNQCSVGNNTLIGMNIIVEKPIGDNFMYIGKIKKPVPVDDYRVFL